jgi:rSAM/selenodomain-associated transferase 1
MQERALIIFIKNPERGKVKTRLASTVGDERALTIYRALLTHTRQVALEVNAKRYLYYANFIPEVDEWSPQDFEKRLQSEGDLGVRMATAFEQVLREHKHAILVGSDIAQLEKSILEKAFQALSEHPFVLGPARDGGYYLLGMNTYHASVFSSIDWSTDRVFDQTRDRIKALGSTPALVEELSDIDYEADWEAFGWSLEGD